MDRSDDQAAAPAHRAAHERAAVAAAPPVHEPAPPSDAGEPMGSKDPDRPAMLGNRFRATLAIGMVAGLAIALVGHVLLASGHGSGSNGWSWLLAAIGGVVVGGACTLFFYGASTDRTDTGPTKAHGRADVSETGEWQKTLNRRRRHRGRGSRSR